MGFKIDHIATKEHSFKKKKEQGVPLLQKEISLGSPFSNKTKESFYTELSVLLKAGVSLKNALGLLKDSQKKKPAKEITNTIVNNIIGGMSLSEAVKAQKQFTDYEYYSLKIGEETGTLAVVSQQLGSFFAKKNEQRRNLISALTYPIIILSTAVVVVVFMLQFVVPMFQGIFKQQHAELPAITKFIIKLSGFIKNYGWLMLLAIIGMVFSRAFLNKKVWYRKQKDKFLVKIPFIGKFIKIMYLSQFTQAVSLLTASKVPMLHSIQLVKKMIDFYPLQTALKDIEESILKGNSLSVGLSQHKLFDDKMIALVKVAEETNQNEFIFERLNTQYNTQVQQQSKILSTVMEPFIIMIVGLLVGIILVAMYLPMFKLSSVLG